MTVILVKVYSHNYTYLRLKVVHVYINYCIKNKQPKNQQKSILKININFNKL